MNEIIVATPKRSTQMMIKEHGRSCYEVDRQKRKLYEIGISLVETDETRYTASEFSTILIFNYTQKPLKEHQKTLLLGFEELDEFLHYNVQELYQFFSFRFSKYKRRLISPANSNRRKIASAC